MSVYPNAIDTFRAVQNIAGQVYNVNNLTTVYAEDQLQRSSAIVAVETELGTNPSGSSSTVAVRLNAIEALIGVDMLNIYPVGSILEFGDTLNTPNSRGILGTWVRFATGRVLVDQKTGDPAFGTIGATGGAVDVTLTTAQMPAHTHTQNAHGHDVVTDQNGNLCGVSGSVTGSGNMIARGSTVDFLRGIPVVASNQNTGGGTPHNNLQPYIVIARWIRTV